MRHLLGLLLGLFVLGLLVLVHELGHLVVAKRIGVPVHKFSIGFGPSLVSKKIGETVYCIAALPFGGFVQLEDEDGALGGPGSFRAQPAWKQFITYLAGPATNLFVGFLLYIGVYLAYGVPVISSRIGQVGKESPAERAGLQAGDLISTVNGDAVTQWEEVIQKLSQATQEGPVELGILRGTENLTLRVVPEFSEGRPRIGIGADMTNPARLRDPSVAFTHGIRTGNFVIVQTAGMLTKLFAGKVSVKDNLGGPVQIVAIGNQAYKEHGLEGILMVAAGLSLGLFILNLLPIPIVDGGQIAFILLAIVRGKQLELKTEFAIKNAVAILLLGLAVFLTYNDISRLLR